MGKSLLSCYQGEQIFEAYGLGKEVVDFCFAGSVSRIGGMGFSDLQHEAESFWAKVSMHGGTNKYEVRDGVHIATLLHWQHGRCCLAVVTMGTSGRMTRCCAPYH